MERVRIATSIAECFQEFLSFYFEIRIRNTTYLVPGVAHTVQATVHLPQENQIFRFSQPTTLLIEELPESNRNRVSQLKMARNLQVACLEDQIFVLVINASNSLLTLPEGTLIGTATLCIKEVDQINMMNFPFPDITEEQWAHVRASTNNHQSAKESSTPSSLPNLKSISQTDFEDEEELLNPDFYPTWQHRELHMNYIPASPIYEPENQPDEERRRRTQQSRARLFEDFELPDVPSNLTLKFMAQWAQ